jgi:hypothetical protein
VAGIATACIGLQATSIPPDLHRSRTGAMNNLGILSDMGGMPMPLGQPIPAGPVTPLASLTGR